MSDAQTTVWQCTPDLRLHQFIIQEPGLTERHQTDSETLYAGFAGAGFELSPLEFTPARSDKRHSSLRATFTAKALDEPEFRVNHVLSIVVDRGVCEVKSNMNLVWGAPPSARMPVSTALKLGEFTLAKVQTAPDVYERGRILQQLRAMDLYKPGSLMPAERVQRALSSLER